MAQDPTAAVSDPTNTDENAQVADATTATTASTISETKMEDIPIERDLDIVIYGATGFTGQHLAKYLATRIATSALRLNWGIAGRSETKLRQLHSVLKQTYEDALADNNTDSKTDENNTNTITKTKDDLNNLPILIGDVMKPDELKSIVCRTKLIISCVGPYRFFGEHVVQLCAENGTHYVDICGEPEFMDRCAFKYFKTAQNNNSIIVHACGFDSIPSDMGSDYLNQLYLKENGLCSNIEVYITLSIPNGYTGHATTFEAAVHGFSSVDDLRKFRKELSTVDWRHDRKKITRIGPKQHIHKETYFWSKIVNKWSMIFPFADSSVVCNSQGIRSSLLNQQGIKKCSFPQFAAYLTFNNKLATYQAVAIGGFGTLLTKFDWGKNLMLKYPKNVTFGAFSHEGPSEEQMNGTTFQSKCFGQGYSEETIEKAREQLKTQTKEKENESKNEEDSDKDEIDELHSILGTMAFDLNIEASVTGGDPGYKATAIMSVETSLCLLEELELIQKGSLQLNVPAIKGGVFTPSAVFGATTLTERLSKAGVVFSVDGGLPVSSVDTSIAATEKVESTSSDNDSKQQL